MTISPETKKPKGIPLTKKVADKVKLILLGIAICFLCCVLIWQGLTWDIARCYPMDPWEFKAQTKLIKPGMSEDKALSLIKGSNNLKREGNETRIFLNPIKEGIIAPTVGIWIILQLDDENKVIKVTWADG